VFNQKLDGFIIYSPWVQPSASENWARTNWALISTAFRGQRHLKNRVKRRRCVHVGCIMMVDGGNNDRNGLMIMIYNG
jgi:hypothetical protein